MADNNQRLTEQLQALAQRWQNVLLHPVQAMSGGRVEALFFPARHQRFLDSNSEIALNPAAMAERRGQGEDITRLVTEVRDVATGIRADVAEKSQAQTAALHDETQEFTYAPQREERSSGHGGLREHWARPGSYYGLRQESEIGPAFSPLRDEAKRGVTAESAGGLRQEPTNARLGLRDQSATLDTIEALQHRVQQLTTPAQSRSQARHRDQGMGL